MSRFFVNAMQIVVLLVLLSGLSYVVHAQSKTAQSADTAHVWTATDTQRKLLAPQTHMIGYAISTPLNYTLSPDLAAQARSTLKHYSQVVAWKGVSRANSSYAFLLVATLNFPSATAESVVSEPMLEGFVRGIQTTRTNFIHDKIEEGTLMGMQAYRVHWTGDMIRPEDHSLVHTGGLAYVIFDPIAKNAVLIFGEDTEPYFTSDTAPALEASALTLTPS